MGPLVVGVRGARSLATLAWAADRAHSHGVEVVAVHVAEPFPDVPEAWMAPWPCDDPAWLAEVLDLEWCEVLRVRGVRFRTELAIGAVIPSLCGVARREGASMLVVGRPQHRFFGSVGARLVREASCSVVFVAGFDELSAAPPAPRRHPTR